jgi:hypothetical protein
MTKTKHFCKELQTVDFQPQLLLVFLQSIVNNIRTLRKELKTKSGIRTAF